MARAVLRDHPDLSREAFNGAMDQAIHQGLRPGGRIRARAPVPRLRHRRWMVPGDSAYRLPTFDLVRRRNLDVDRELTPWLATPYFVCKDLLRRRSVARCGTANPHTARHCRCRQRAVGDVAIRDLARTRTCDVGAGIASDFPFPDAPRRWVDQGDFPAILSAVRRTGADRARRSGGTIPEGRGVIGNGTQRRMGRALVVLGLMVPKLCQRRRGPGQQRLRSQAGP